MDALGHKLLKVGDTRPVVAFSQRHIAMSSSRLEALCQENFEVESTWSFVEEVVGPKLCIKKVGSAWL